VGRDPISSVGTWPRTGTLQRRSESKVAIRALDQNMDAMDVSFAASIGNLCPERRQLQCQISRQSEGPEDQGNRRRINALKDDEERAAGSISSPPQQAPGYAARIWLQMDDFGGALTRASTAG
jgi:hypothetical protein